MERSRCVNRVAAEAVLMGGRALIVLDRELIEKGGQCLASLQLLAYSKSSAVLGVM